MILCPRMTSISTVILLATCVLVETGESRTPRPEEIRPGYATGLASFFSRLVPPSTG